jgi:uncharacterized protein (DUF2249 family)
MADRTERVIDTRTASDSCANLTMQAIDAMTVGESFLLISDHDPVGLHYMLDAEHPGVAEWEPLEDGPDRWQVRVSKVGRT